jgi:hypothetical protein
MRVTGGPAAPTGIGVFEEPIHLTVSGDGNTLSGTWQGQNGPESMSVTRLSKRVPDDAVCGDLQKQLDSNQQDLDLLGPQMDQQLQTAFRELGTAATLRSALEGAQGAAFFGDPHWTTLPVLDAATVQSSAQLTDGYLVAVPTTVMNDLVQVMARGADDAESNDSLTSQLAAQGCVGAGA